MLNAGGSEDFPADFSFQQNAPNAAPHLVNILWASLIFQEKKDSSKAVGTKVWDIFSRFRCLKEGYIAPATEEPRIHLHDSGRLILQEANRGRAIATRTDIPMYFDHWRFARVKGKQRIC